MSISSTIQSKLMPKKPVLWSITGWDWLQHIRAAGIARCCLRGDGGEVVLLHDGTHTEPDGDRSRSLRATEAVLRRLGADGHQVVTVPELMSA